MTENQGYLTTHILDTAIGVPAAGVKIDLYRLTENGRVLLISAKTNADGRTDAPLLKQGEMTAGTYELVFMIGDYFVTTGSSAAAGFIDVVPVRFNISDAQSHYHVPLLASPFSYATYRGS